ncbi:MAG TPA: EAL domain-containing protein [Gaiellaceae bacterium]|nr:EAL domain-containing protein [Gaiellaceae bacterium]
MSTHAARLPGGFARRRRDAHLRAILDAAMDAVVTIDHRGLVLEFNRAAEEMFGYRREEVLGRELAGLVVPERLRAAHRAALRRWTEHGPGPGAGTLLGRRVQVEAQRADGSVFPAELALLRVDVPGPPLFTASIRDLSERKTADEQLREADFRYRTLVEQLPLVSYVNRPDDPVSRPFYVSPQLEGLLGYSPEEWLATPGLFERSLHEEDRERVLAEKRAAYERREAHRTEYRMRTADGRVVWVEDQSVHVQPPGGGPGFRRGFALDITERKATEDALRRAELRYRTLVEQLPLAIYIDRLDETSSNVYTSPQIEAMLGYSVQEWAENPDLFVELLHPEDRERVLAAHRRTHATGEPLHLEYRLRRRDGRWVWVQDQARVVAEGGESFLQGYLLDVTARREAEEQLRHQALHDPLTGLANRALFVDRLEHALVVGRAHGREAGVLFVDLDDFKRVNDTVGHHVGDAVLCAVGARLVESLPASSTVARVGGDEFAVLVEDDDAPAAAVDAAERVVEALKAPVQVEGREVFVTASVGIAAGAEVDELLRSADVAMYRAKSGGKAQYIVYGEAMDEELADRFQLVSDLRRARFDRELAVLYQPIVDLGKGTFVGAEALVRWRHPTRGLLSPAEFIALAEETGAIVEIGRRVLEDACRQVAAWRRAAPGERPFVSVNVSVRQLWGGGFEAAVAEALERYALEPEALMLEVTESVLARRREEVADTLAALARRGVRIALDDFGTGYSSLSQLQDLPVDVVKIDRSFIRALAREPSRIAFVRAIVDLAAALDLALVAEGIEGLAEASLLRGLGCALGQGFYFSEPIPGPRLLELAAGGDP